MDGTAFNVSLRRHLPRRGPLLGREDLSVPVGHGAGDGKHGVQAAEEDAIQQHLADARRQRQRRQVPPQHRQLLRARLHASALMSSLSLQDLKGTVLLMGQREPEHCFASPGMLY